MRWNIKKNGGRKKMLKYSLLALILGFVLDLLIGDPRWLYHPVCVIGNLITVLRKPFGRFFRKVMEESWQEAL